MTDNDDNICLRRIPFFPDAPKNDPLSMLASFECKRPKSPDRLYCPSCEAEAFGEDHAQVSNS